jgi:hypothetical protein
MTFAEHINSLRGVPEFWDELMKLKQQIIKKPTYYDSHNKNMPPRWSVRNMRDGILIVRRINDGILQGFDLSNGWENTSIWVSHFPSRCKNPIYLKHAEHPRTEHRSWVLGNCTYHGVPHPENAVEQPVDVWDAVSEEIYLSTCARGQQLDEQTVEELREKRILYQEGWLGEQEVNLFIPLDEFLALH